MSVALLLAATSAAAAGAGVPVVIDLTVAEPCAEADHAAMNGEIVVCGERERQEYYRIVKSDRQAGKPLPKAEVQVAKGTALAIETESEDLGMARTQRAMVRLKFKF